MRKYNKIADELTEAFIHYQYRLDNPMPDPSETSETRIHRYQSDAIFNTKVNGMVAGVMRIVTNHCEDLE